jgi:hypothetical protein
LEENQSEWSGLKERKKEREEEEVEAGTAVGVLTSCEHYPRYVSSITPATA